MAGSTCEFSRSKVSLRAVEVGRHDRAVVRAVLPVVGLAELDAGDLGDGVRLVGRFQGAAQQVFLAHRLGAVARVDAGASQEEKPLDPGLEGRVDHVAFNHQVLVDEIGPVGAVGVDAADPGGRHEHRVDLLPVERSPCTAAWSIRSSSACVRVMIRCTPACSRRTMAEPTMPGARRRRWLSLGRGVPWSLNHRTLRPFSRYVAVR